MSFSVLSYPNRVPLGFASFQASTTTWTDNWTYIKGKRGSTTRRKRITSKTKRRRTNKTWRLWLEREERIIRPGGNLRPKRRHDDINSVNAVIRTNPKYRASIKPGTSDNYLYWTLDVCPPSCRFYERFSAALLRFLLSFWPPLATILDPWLFQVRRSFDSL